MAGHRGGDGENAMVAGGVSYRHCAARRTRPFGGEEEPRRAGERDRRRRHPPCRRRGREPRRTPASSRAAGDQPAAMTAHGRATLLGDRIPVDPPEPHLRSCYVDAPDATVMRRSCQDDMVRDPAPPDRRRLQSCRHIERVPWTTRDAPTGRVPPIRPESNAGVHWARIEFRPALPVTRGGRVVAPSIALRAAHRYGLMPWPPMAHHWR